MLGGSHGATCYKRTTQVYLVPQVLGGAPDICVEMGQVDQLADASFSGCPGDLLGDAHKHVLKAEVTGRGNPEDSRI